MLRILLICTGNTCRSPMAEVLLQELIRQEGWTEQITVSSAGLAAANGEPASLGAYKAMARRSLMLQQHSSRRITVTMLQEADLILTMSPSHRQALLALAPEKRDKIYTLSQYAGENGAISDPYGGGDAIYEACAQQLEKLLRKIWGKIATLAGINT
jgi:protein-tyrosine-phosphatase